MLFSVCLGNSPPTLFASLVHFSPACSTICLFVCLCVSPCLSSCSPVCVYVCLFDFFFCLFVCFSYPSVGLLVYPFLVPIIFLSVCLSLVHSLGFYIFLLFTLCLVHAHSFRQMSGLVSRTGYASLIIPGLLFSVSVCLSFHPLLLAALD